MTRVCNNKYSARREIIYNYRQCYSASVQVFKFSARESRSITNKTLVAYDAGVNERQKIRHYRARSTGE